MSELRKTFVNSSLEDFLSSGYQLPRNVQIIPYAYIRNSDEILAILTLNNLQVLTDFGTTYSERLGLINYIRKDLDINSLGIFKRSKEYIIENGSIAYVKANDVSSGSDILFKPIPPIVFIKFEFETSEDLEVLISDFTHLFVKKNEGVIESDSSTNNLVFLNVSDLFYISRGTTAKKFDPKSGNMYTFDISEGYPADSRISRIYRSVSSAGDIPFDSHINRYANCCPKVEFYYDVSSTMSYSLHSFFNMNLPILMKTNVYESIMENIEEV